MTRAEGIERDLGTRWRGRRRATVTLATGGAGALTLLLLVSGTSLGASAASHPSHFHLVAPYSGEGYGEVGVFNSGCRLTDSTPVDPVVNSSSGWAEMSGKVTAGSCGASNSSTEVTLFGGLDSNATFQTTNGVHTLTSRWVIDLSTHLTASPGGPTQNATAELIVYPYMYLADLTSGAVYMGSQPFAIYENVSSGSFAHTFAHVHTSSSIVTTFVRSHTYEFGVGIEVELVASVTPGTSSASASVNMATGARGAELLSVTLS